MNGNCFGIGTFQAFLDGELSQGESLKFSAHLAACDRCAAMLVEAENELSIVFPALEREFNTLVPTQRLWNKINDSIAVETQRISVWNKAWAFLAIQVATPSVAMAATVLLIFGLFAAVWISRNGSTANKPGPTLAQDHISVSTSPITIPDSLPVEPVSDRSGDRVSTTLNSGRITATNAIYTAPRRAVVDQTPNISSGPLPGEENYVKTIASLSRSADNQKDNVMRPSERISFERDMAVVDDAIKKMRAEVKKNPKNESARQVLYSSYQNKIDLLSSVSQKQELMASLR